MSQKLKQCIFYRQLLFLLLVTASLSFNKVSGQAKDSFSLKDCIQFTLRNHPNSSIYANNAQVSREKIRENKAAFLPSVSANTSLDYNIKLQTSVIPAGAFSPTETKLQLGNKFSTGGYLQADQTIFDKSSALAIKSSRVDKEIADLNVLKENETLIYNTASAYYEVLTYGEKGTLLRDNENQYKQLLDILKLRYEQGVVKKSEYDRSRVNLNNVQSELALNDNYLKLALNKLKNAMGLDLKAPLAIDQHVDYSAHVDLQLINELDTSKLTDFKIDQQNLSSKEIDVKKKKAAFLPTFSIYAKYGVNAYGSEFSNAFTNWFDYSAIGVKLSIPIFSGFKKSSQLKQSQLNLQTQNLTLKLNVQNYKLDFENAGNNLFSSYTSLKKNKENLDLAREVMDASAIEYREGTATLSSYLDADSSFKEAQTNYITSLLDFLTAQIALEKAKGSLTSYVTNLK
jgi:outer membrane protein TolC